MKLIEYGIAFALAVPALALVCWAILLRREMKDSDDKKKMKIH